jgi:hypothetical protein
VINHQQALLAKIYVLKLFALRGSDQLLPLSAAALMDAKSSEAEVRWASVAQTFSGNVSVNVVSDVVGFMARI